MTSKIKIDLSRICSIEKIDVTESGERYIAWFDDHLYFVALTKDQFDNLKLELEKHKESLMPIDEKIRELQSKYRLPKEVWI